MTRQTPRILILVAVVLVALTMRGAITAVPPLLTNISDDLRITPATAGLLTSLPVLMFALADRSPWWPSAPPPAREHGNGTLLGRSPAGVAWPA